jgi:CO/xanthine dehydrogenase FAD-binding subunit
VGTGIGSAGPTPLRARAAEALARDLPWDGGLLDDDVVAAFADQVATAAAPIDDVRSSAGYRRHALRVLAGRALRRTWRSYLDGSSVDGGGA